MDYLSDQLLTSGIEPSVDVAVQQKRGGKASASLVRLRSKPKHSSLRQKPGQMRNQLDKHRSMERARAGKLRRILKRVVEDLNVRVFGGVSILISCLPPGSQTLNLGGSCHHFLLPHFCPRHAPRIVNFMRFPHVDDIVDSLCRKICQKKWYRRRNQPPLSLVGRAGAPRSSFVSGGGGPEHHGVPLSLARKAGAPWSIFVSGGGGPDHDGVPLSLAAGEAGAPWNTCIVGGGRLQHHGVPLSLAVKGQAPWSTFVLEEEGWSTIEYLCLWG